MTNAALTLLGLVALCCSAAHAHGEDWPMQGRDRTRNAASPEKGAPIEWNLKTGQNIKWKARLGDISAAEPVVSGGLVWIGTNNDPPHDPAVKGPAGILACFRESDGAFVYQHASTATNRLVRRAMFGLTGSPMIEGDRLWFVTVNAMTVCLDISPLRQGLPSARQQWQLDFVSELDVFPAIDVMGNKGMCSIGGSLGNRIFAITGNGRDWTRTNVPVPRAPALVCLDKDSGKVLWEDASPGSNIILGEYGSPLVFETGGIAQVVAPQGDGWIRSFEATTGKLLWKFDINPKSQTNNYTRNFFQNAPVFHHGHVFVATGRDVESGEGPGRLVCLDPTRRGDLSLELEDGAGHGVPNPNSGAIWHFDGCGRTLSNPVIERGRVVLVDFSGTIWVLNEATGTLVWKHTLGGQVWGSPLVVDDKIYTGNIDGEVDILAFGDERKVIAHHEFEAPVNASPIFANGVLYIASGSDLFAIAQGRRSAPAAQ